MSYKDGYKKELGTAEPAGSLAPMNSTQDGSKWHHGVDAAGIAKLTKISTEINKVVEDTVSAVTKAQIRIGRLLNEARALIPGDLQFGQWREANTSINNKSTANKLMNLAKQVGDGRITNDLVEALPISTLKELMVAPDNVITAIREQLKEDPENIPTREDVREQVKEEKKSSSNGSGSPATHSAPAAPVKAPPPAPQEIISVRVIVDKIIAKPLKERLKHLDPKGDAPFKGCKPVEWAFLVFGMDPDPASLPNPQVIDILHEAFMDLVNDDDHGTILNRARELIDKEY